MTAYDTSNGPEHTGHRRAELEQLAQPELAGERVVGGGEPVAGARRSDQRQAGTRADRGCSAARPGRTSGRCSDRDAGGTAPLRRPPTGPRNAAARRTRRCRGQEPTGSRPARRGSPMPASRAPACCLNNPARSASRTPPTNDSPDTGKNIRAEEPAAQPRELIGRAGRPELVPRRRRVVRAQQVGPQQHAVHVLGRLVGAGHERHLIAHDDRQQPGQQRVVRAARAPGCRRRPGSAARGTPRPARAAGGRWSRPRSTNSAKRGQAALVHLDARTRRRTRRRRRRW